MPYACNCKDLNCCFDDGVLNRTTYMYIHRSTTLYRKNLDDSGDFGTMIGNPIRKQIYDLEAFGGSLYYHAKTFNRDVIANADSTNFVFSNSAAFKDITFMHHSLQPGEWLLTCASVLCVCAPIWCEP